MPLALLITMKMNHLNPVFGLVTACDWDEKGLPVRIKICAPGEVDYYVLENDRGRQLMTCIREWVEITGRVTDVDAMKIIEVESFVKHLSGGNL